MTSFEFSIVLFSLFAVVLKDSWGFMRLLLASSCLVEVSLSVVWYLGSSWLCLLIF